MSINSDVKTLTFPTVSQEFPGEQGTIFDTAFSFLLCDQTFGKLIHGVVQGFR